MQTMVLQHKTDKPFFLSRCFLSCDAIRCNIYALLTDYLNTEYGIFFSISCCLAYKEVIFGQIATNWNARLKFQKIETANQSKKRIEWWDYTHDEKKKEKKRRENYYETSLQQKRQLNSNMKKKDSSNKKLLHITEKRIL